MKQIKNLLLCMITSLLAMVAKAETVTYNFENGLPSAWACSGVTIKKDNGSNRAAMSSGATMVTDAMPNLKLVEYKHRGSGNGKKLVVEKSIDGGATWTSIGETTVSSASAYGTASHTIGENSTPATIIRFTCMSATIYVDDIIFTTGSGGDVEPIEPTEPTITAGAAMISFGKVKVGEERTRIIPLAAACLQPEAGVLFIESSSPTVTISTDGQTFDSSVQLTYSEGMVSGAELHVRFAPADYMQYDAQVQISGGAAKHTITIKGEGSTVSCNEYYIAPDGNDATGDGTIMHPWMNLQKVVDIAQPGDVIICRGGRYHFTSRDSSNKLTVRIKRSGTASDPITIRNYDGEQPIFDFEQQLIDCNRDRSKVGDRGIHLTGNYWVLYGLHITHAADNGIKLEGSHNRIERCEFSYNLDTGIQLGFGHNFSDSGFGSQNDGSYCAYNDIIDCDSHHNCDFDTNYGSDADGFACKMHNGKGNRFIRCRAWRNSDDAWDLFETDFSVTLIECWAWESGKSSDYTLVYDYFDKGPNFSGNGNGIKLGGNGTGGSSKGVHYAYNCVAFGNNVSGSVKGFDCNNHKGGHVLVGCLGFDNGYDFMFESGGGANSEFYNNVCFGRQEILVGTESNNGFLGNVQAGKTFCNNVVKGFNRADYESLSEEDAMAPRGIDGSMPARFARLKYGSALIDKGLDKPVPYTGEFPFLLQPIMGAARDLGPYEYLSDASSALQAIVNHKSVNSFRITNGRTSGERIAVVSSETRSDIIICLYNVGGQYMGQIASVKAEKGVDYYLPLDMSSLKPGVYVCKATIADQSYSAKLSIR